MGDIPGASRRGVSGLADVIDLDRYPIDRLDSPAGQHLVARCGRELAAIGASDVEGFMRPAAVACVVDWAMTAMPDAYWTDTEHNIYFTAEDPDLPADDPRRTRVRSVKGGLAYGRSDDFGIKVAEHPVHVHDLHATILHLLGIDHERLTYRYAGRDFRLTDVHGRVVKDIFA